MSYQIRHGYKRTKSGVRVAANWELLRISRDGTVTTIGKLSKAVAIALALHFAYGD